MKFHFRKCPNGTGEVGRWDAEAAGVLVSVRVVVDGICVAVSVWATLYVGQWLRRPTPSHTVTDAQNACFQTAGIQQRLLQTVLGVLVPKGVFNLTDAQALEQLEG